MKSVAFALMAGVLLGPAWATPVPATGTVEVLFTPGDDAEGAAIRAVREARKAIYAQVYLLTSRSMGKALLEAAQRGVRVEVLADREMTASGDNSQVPLLAAAGIPVRLEVRYVAAHNKILLVDPESENPVVISGSYNFTWSAQARNAENLLIFRGNPGLAAAYLQNWRRHREDAVPYQDALSAGVAGMTP